jgi:hypothetical protein
MSHLYYGKNKNDNPKKDPISLRLCVKFLKKNATRGRIAFFACLTNSKYLKELYDVLMRSILVPAFIFFVKFPGRIMVDTRKLTVH